MIFSVLLGIVRARQQFWEALESDHFYWISWYRWNSIDFFSSARNCQKSPEMLRISRKWSILWDFLVWMEFDWFFQFWLKLPEIARNVKNLQKVIDFVVFPGIDGIRSDWPAASWGDTQIGPKSDRWQNRYADSDAGHTHSGRNMEPGPT